LATKDAASKKRLKNPDLRYLSEIFTISNMVKDAAS